jgi:hypothetical protein
MNATLNETKFSSSVQTYRRRSIIRRIARARTVPHTTRKPFDNGEFPSSYVP